MGSKGARPRASWTPQAGDETSNSHARREREGYYSKYFRGRVIDIGCGKSTVTPDARPWDIARGDGDATLMTGVKDESYDTVYASHVLEHLDDPKLALRNWWRILRLGGYLIVAVPDSGLYEQGLWPSVFNSDHRHAFTVHKSDPAEHEVNLVDLLRALPDHEVISIRRCDEGYDYEARDRAHGALDQSHAERQVEAIVRKAPARIWKYTLAMRVSCACGSQELGFLGVQVTGRVLLVCFACGQRSTADIRPEGRKEARPEGAKE